MLFPRLKLNRRIICLALEGEGGGAAYVVIPGLSCDIIVKRESRGKKGDTSMIFTKVVS